MRCAHKILVGKPTVKKIPRRPRPEWEDDDDDNRRKIG